MDTDTFLQHLRAQSWYRDQIVHTEAIASREPRFASLDPPLHHALDRRLEELGLLPLYVHQAAAIERLRTGGNVIVSTPAASGKSLCYNLPVLQSLLERRNGRALYVYPTKSLAQDQFRKLHKLSNGLPVNIRVATYDGDTGSEDRAEIRRSAQIVLTNPDMLHLGILPNPRQWRSFFRELRYVIVDESHVYRGVFGSHVANVIRRLRRVSAMYGSAPQFVLCSATVANPSEHAEALIGAACPVIDDDGAPFSGKDFVLWNPPLIDEGTMARRSSNSEATLAFTELVKNEVRTITFSRTRKVAELVYMYVRDRLIEQGRTEQAAMVRPYRAGYLAKDRRAIEQGLFEGDLLGVSATNALELGVDVGDLDATILTGYPGTVASAWQQAGRSGRRSERSLSIMIAADSPLDQYLMRHPADFFGRPQEHALIAPANPYILKPHLLCAAYEAPLTRLDEALFGDAMWPLLRESDLEGRLRQRHGRWFPSTGVGYPAEEVSIRSANAAYFHVIEEDSGRLLEQVDAGSVFSQLHPGAVYLHQGETFVVSRLELDQYTALVRPHLESYYTVPRDHTDIQVLRLSSRSKIGGTGVYLGQVDVSNTVVAFRRKRQFTEEMLGDQPLDLPTRSFVTAALWFDIPTGAIDEIERLRLDLAGGLHAAEHAAIGMLPFFAMCDRADIGGVSTPLHADTGQPQIFIYDGHPGGVGIVEKGYELIYELWYKTLETIVECPCEAGCPSCIQSPKCGNNNSPLDKRAADIILSRLVGTPGTDALDQPGPTVAMGKSRVKWV